VRCDNVHPANDFVPDLATNVGELLVAPFMTVP
jgi:hypothetical protein